MAWGLFPVLFTGAGLSVGRIGVLAALYPAVWGLGAARHRALSDRWGASGSSSVGCGCRRWPSRDRDLGSFGLWAVGAVLLGAGTAMVYPTLLAAVGDVAHPSWRARAVGVYRLWRDGGFAVGALLAGVVADALGVRAAVWVVAVLTARLRARGRRADVRDPRHPSWAAPRLSRATPSLRCPWSCAVARPASTRASRAPAGRC